MIRFHFDYISPYAYLAWTQIHALAARHGREVEAVPVLFAGLLRAHGTLGPAEIPAKRAYVAIDIFRKARRLGVPIAPPPAHPFNPLAALRASIAVEPASQRALIDALYAATWAGGDGVEGDDRIFAIANAAGLDGAAIVSAANSPAAKDGLRINTERAIADGAFGVPTMIADGALFWGVDALDTLDDHLAGRVVVDRAFVDRWKDLPASSHRKR